jgi:hypothetical protein
MKTIAKQHSRVLVAHVCAGTAGSLQDHCRAWQRVQVVCFACALRMTPMGCVLLTVFHSLVLPATTVTQSDLMQLPHKPHVAPPLWQSLLRRFSSLPSPSPRDPLQPLQPALHDPAALRPTLPSGVRPATPLQAAQARATALGALDRVSRLLASHALTAASGGSLQLLLPPVDFGDPFGIAATQLTPPPRPSPSSPLYSCPIANHRTTHRHSALTYSPPETQLTSASSAPRELPVSMGACCRDSPQTCGVAVATGHHYTPNKCTSGLSPWGPVHCNCQVVGTGERMHDFSGVLSGFQPSCEQHGSGGCEESGYVAAYRPACTGEGLQPNGLGSLALELDLSIDHVPGATSCGHTCKFGHACTTRRRA